MPRPPTGRGSAASATATNRATRRNGNISCWRGCCSHKTARARPSRCSSGCSPRQQPRAGSVASSRYARCRRWRAASGDEPGAMDALAEALTLPRLPPRLGVGLRRGGTAHGCPARPAGRRPAGRTGPSPRRPAQLPGPARAGIRRQTRHAGLPAQRCLGGAGPGRAADRPRAGGAGDAGRRHAEPGHRRGTRIILDTVKKHVSHILGKLGAANRTEVVARARELGGDT